MMDDEHYACDVCGSCVKTGKLEDAICTCCFGIICDAHTAKVTCPHKPGDHDDH